MNKIEKKIIKKRIIHKGKKHVSIEVEVIEMECPLCSKKWITVYINGDVVTGGYAICNGIEKCFDCI